MIVQSKPPSRDDRLATDSGRWRDPKNEARVHWKVSSVPTILRLEEVSHSSLYLPMTYDQGKETARLVEDEIMDKKRWSEFVKTE